MKAAVLTSLNSNLEIFDLTIPELSKNQVLVKIKAAGVCGAQLNQKKGIKIKEEFLPCLMGHEGSGIVEKIGPGVEKVKPGDKVVMHWRKSSGVDSEFPKYQSKYGTVGSGLITTFSEFSVVPSDKSIKQPLFTILLSRLCHALYKSDKAILRELSQVAKSNIKECPLHHEVIAMLNGAEKNLSSSHFQTVLCTDPCNPTYPTANIGFPNQSWI